MTPTDRSSCITAPYPAVPLAPPEGEMVRPPDNLVDLECWAVSGEIAGR